MRLRKRQPDQDYNSTGAVVTFVSRGGLALGLLLEVANGVDN
jgi:hypothetical protein